jgi:hypothetical protein
MTVEEELTRLDDAIRRLKIDYDIYFAGGSKRPPYDAQWSVESVIKKYSDNRSLSFAQRFRFNSIMQKYALFSDLWRQKVKRREEGYEDPHQRRPSVPAAAEKQKPAPGSFKVQWQDPDQEHDKVDKLYQALVAAKKQLGENTDSLNAEGFKRFVKQKTAQLQKDLRCANVEYVVEVENGQVRLKAKGA